MIPPAALAGPFAEALAHAPPGRIGVAVSGGSDSTALLLLMRDWAAARGRAIAAVTVDHGLRPESAAEAAAVSELCGRLGVPHATCRRDAAALRGNLQAAAREARLALIAAWAAERDVAAVALGHTLDDQAETFVLRLARGSGVDGLAGMPASGRVNGLTLLRPMLALRRAALRAWLAEAGVAWAEDPTNEDSRFDRVRARAALPALAALGIGPERLAATAGAMARSRAALEASAGELARLALTPGAGGDLALDPDAIADAPEELGLRVMAGALVWVSGARFRPRLRQTRAALAACVSGALGRGLTAHGCVLRPSGAGVAIRREPSRVAAPTRLASGRWDGRWRYVGPADASGRLRMGALGARELSKLAGWRQAGLARETLLSAPAVRDGERLVAAPLAGLGDPGLFERDSAVAPPWEAGLLR